MERPGLYVVATPIGNLGDMIPRALEVLREVDLVVAEDTRHTKRLLTHFGIATPLASCHEHSPPASVRRLAERLSAGAALALVSDAGTPMVSDPGYALVDLALGAGVPVRAVPGPSALTAALSVAGLPTQRFIFEGFLPPRAAARRHRLEALLGEPRTLVFFEAPHRLCAFLAAAVEVFGSERRAALARELSKVHETVRRASLGELRDWVADDPEQRRGELVLLVEGASEQAADEEESRRLLSLLLAELPFSRAVTLAARLSRVPRRQLYQLALSLRSKRG